MADEPLDDLEKTEELFEFLQGNLPDGYEIPGERIPRLTEEQAWIVVWYLGNLYWKVPDFIERCDICGNLFDSNEGGDCLDAGDAPHHFCCQCDNGPEYHAKLRLHHELASERGVPLEET